MKRTVQVKITKEIEIEILPRLFAPMTQEQYLAEYNKFFGASGLVLDDVIKHAACSIANYGEEEIEAIGKVGGPYALATDLAIRFKELSDVIETEFVGDAL